MANGNYIVRPIYLRHEFGGPARTRLFMLFDTENPIFDDYRGARVVVPNRILQASGVRAIHGWFAARSIPSGNWRLAPPHFGHIDDIDSFTMGIECEYI